MMKLVLTFTLLAAVHSYSVEVSPFAGFTGDNNEPCYSNPSNGKDGGICLQTDCCAGATYISNLCPDYQNNVKCCYSYNSCNTNAVACASQSAACEVLGMHEKGQINLKGEHFDPSGNNPYDGASALSNIRDTCYGKHAKLSSYGNAPGGTVCLTTKMVTSLRDYARNYYNSYGRAIEVNALAGSSHSATSWHYEGNTFDVGCTYPTDHCSALVSWCRNQNPVELCYPGSSCGGHETWVHCAH
ncbi:Uncharacterized protein APZ42_034120 [Daphnia magna]|uniref:Uncharacterized protein n=2 Tax=Daphnia magna TaxID=35525 RepID=A0ABQ9ZYY6_9CRUS|nr:hypothetical protein OUZ56_000193 [Daphnia magna]KZS03265.1 Uncharacterized protein APZ42_034120 [Daphnia magna]